MRKAVTGEEIIEPRGAYSAAIWAGPTLYLAGICGITEELALVQDITQETQNVMLEAEKILKSQGLTFDNVVSARAYITDMEKFDEFNEAYKSFFKEPFPARATVEVSKLADDANVEIVLTAYDPQRQ